jgi:hypothetical protein
MSKIILAVAMLVSFNLYSQQVNHPFTSIPEKHIFNLEPRLQAQATSIQDEVVIWQEDFENGIDGNNSSTDPSWSVNGDDGELWQKDYNGPNGAFSGNIDPLESTTANNGWMIFDCDSSNTNFNTTPSQINSVVQTRSGELISPYIDVSGQSNVTLSFQHSFRWCCTNAHEILVSVSNDNGTNWTNYQLNESYVTNQIAPTTTTEIIISSVAANQDSVLVKFDWSGDQETASHYFWMIDDVKILETPEYASLLVDGYQRLPSPYFGGTSYSNIPLSQVMATAYFFGGIIENLGVNNLDSARIHGYVESENFYSQSNGATIVSESRDTLFCNDGFAPEMEGTYVSNVYGIDTLNNVTTDTISNSFIVSTFDYARDRADFNESYGRGFINSEGTEQIGNVFDIYEDALLYSIRAYFDESTSANATAKAILNTRNITSGEILYYDETELIAVGQLTEQWIDFVFTSPIEVLAGELFVATIYADYNGQDTVAIANSGISSPGETMLQDIDGTQPGGDSGEWYYTNSTALVRLNFDPNATAPVGITENKGREFNIYPNPNNGQFKISINNTESSNVMLSMQNIIGQNVYTEAINNITKLDKKLDFSNFEKGIYTIIASYENGEMLTQKVVIQ